MKKIIHKIFNVYNVLILFTILFYIFKYYFISPNKIIFLLLISVVFTEFSINFLKRFIFINSVLLFILYVLNENYEFLLSIIFFFSFFNIIKIFLYKTKINNLIKIFFVFIWKKKIIFLLINIFLFAYIVISLNLFVYWSSKLLLNYLVIISSCTIISIYAFLKNSNVSLILISIAVLFIFNRLNMSDLKKPHIFRLNNNKGKMWDQIIIYGNNFEVKNNNSKVLINDEEHRIIYWSKNEIKFIVDPLKTRDGYIKILTKDNNQSNSIPFDYIEL